MENLDDPSRMPDIKRVIETKRSLKRLYEEVYQKIRGCLDRCPSHGIAIELGSGIGFGKTMVPDLVTSDVMPYSGLDLVLDGTRLPFQDRSLRLICMLNAFHHISDAEAFLREAHRCLLPGGRIFIVDQTPGIISTPIFKFFHHEPYHPGSRTWQFETTGPLSGANGALAWMIFKRDLKKFEKLFPELKLIRYNPHTPLRYWLTGGLKAWNLLPVWAFGFATKLDHVLMNLSPIFGSFVDIEIVKLN